MNRYKLTRIAGILTSVSIAAVVGAQCFADSNGFDAPTVASGINAITPSYNWTVAFLLIALPALFLLGLVVAGAWFGYLKVKGLIAARRKKIGHA